MTEQTEWSFPSKSPLLPCVFVPLPLGSIQPRGWLARQLRIQADGLSGHLDEFWPDIAESGWIGGTAEGWERGPYWLDGLVPLAFALRDEHLIAKATHWVDAILQRQHADGWLGPLRDEQSADRQQDAWPVFVLLKALTQWQEATGDARVIPAMQRFFRALENFLDATPLYEWGRYRWAEVLISLHWLYERTGEAWLLRLAELAKAQGFDWQANFDDFRYREKTPFDACTLATHVVNNAMAVKFPALWYRQSHDTRDRDGAKQYWAQLEAYHGAVTGIFSGDEHLAGLSPSQGTELCAVVEAMYSLEELVSILGTAEFADRLERIAFNALPATFTADMWAHQYVQQVNQVLCRIAEDRVYTNNGADANIFGLEPNYGCCTANMHQGWPKFTSHLWMRTADAGIAAIAYAPCEVSACIHEEPVTITVNTEYPFGELLEIIITHQQKAFDFPLYLRVPAWTDGATLTLDDSHEQFGQLVPGTFFRLHRQWASHSCLKLHFPMPTRLEDRPHGAVALSRGPLLYALQITEQWRQISGELPHADWEVYPTSPWNYALRLDRARLAEQVRFRAGEVGDCPFSPQGAPVRARVDGRQLPAWRLERNAAAPPPPGPLASTEPLTSLTLIPYGCSNLRVSEFPVLSEE